MNATSLAPSAQVQSLPQALAYEIDSSHSSATFKVRHLMVSNVRGELGQITGRVLIDESELSRSSVEATIDATAINTRDEKRDAHLRSPDFFDTQTHPTITFRSKRVQPGKGGNFTVTGDLTMRGVTKPVVFDAEFLGSSAVSIEGKSWGSKAGFSATTVVNRKDFGINWNKTLDNGGMMVGDDVTIVLNVEASKAQ